MAGQCLVNSELPIVLSPSGSPSQHIVTELVGSTSTFVGQQWLGAGKRVFLHTHPVEEVIMIMTGRGNANLGVEVVEISAGTTLLFPAGTVHGFRNTGTTPMHVIIVFPVPRFAEITFVETPYDQEIE